MDLYKIEVATFKSEKRFIDWCDDRWYSTSYDKGCRFTKEETDRIVEQLKSHYIYKVNVIDDNGKVEVRSTLVKPRVISKKDFIPIIRANPITGKQVLDINRILKERKEYIERQEELAKKKQQNLTKYEQYK